MSDYIIHNGTLMSEELYHYGVLGMKWGVRRAKKYRDKANMHRSFAKDYDPDDYIGSKPLSAKERSKMTRKANENLAKAKEYDTKAANLEKKHAMKKDSNNRKILSDADIKKKIERLKLERTLKELTQDEVAPGKKYTKEIMSTVGKTVITAAAAGALKYGIKAAMTRKFDIVEAAQYVAPKPKSK